MPKLESEQRRSADQLVQHSAIRWGLCCLVVDAPIRFRSATHSYVWRLSEDDRRRYINAIALENANALLEVLRYCATLGIRAFRVSSQIFPLATHPLSGYGLDALIEGSEVRRRLELARDVARDAGIRLSFHPDQFVVLNSVRPEVVDSAIAELEWQATLAEVIGADVICLHGGSATGGIDAAATRLLAGIDRLSPRARSRLALENDDRCFSAVDLLPVCLASGAPLVLDAHHHRVLDGSLTIEEATDWAFATWGDREPYFHLSSPRGGWDGGDPRPHADFLDPRDVPAYWSALGIPITVDVEAKAKERAVLAIARVFA
jgi:UV DNA damage endonuclease